VLLQQTRADTGIPRYEAFIARFPNVHALARAPLEDVLRAWEGFGYYARARNLHSAARIVVERFDGCVPTDPDRLRTLPGVGPYIAAAVASIAGGAAVAAVDSNVERVAARLFALRGAHGTPFLRRQVAAAVEAAMHAGLSPGDLNQALMDLGAQVCTPSAPNCAACPASEWCAARRTERPEAFPERRPRKPTPCYRVAVGIIWRNGRILIARRPLDRMLGGLWEFPGGKCRPGEREEEAVVREIPEETGLAIELGPKICTIRHAYSHFRIVLTAFHCRAVHGRTVAKSSDELRWVRPSELDNFPFPRANRRLIDALLRRAPPWPQAANSADSASAGGGG